MTEPLGYDRLGRLVYENDLLIHDSGATFYAYRGWKGEVRVHLESCPDSALENGNDKIPITLDRMAVDLAASPKRSNYERYFGDIELNKVYEAVYAICGEQPSGMDCTNGCPFAKWHLHFGDQGHCKSAFTEWLQQEATV